MKASIKEHRVSGLGTDAAAGTRPARIRGRLDSNFAPEAQQLIKEITAEVTAELRKAG